MNGSKVTLWKPPARREYQPKPMDAGQVIVWTVVIPGEWEVPPHYDPETNVYTDGIGWSDPLTYERIGTIWSAGSSPKTWWAQPDGDEANPVLVRSSGKRQPDGTYDGELFQVSGSDGWREAIRRAENVRKHGIYAVALDKPMRSGPGAYSTYSYACYHSDPDCPEAAGREHDERAGGWPLHRIVDVLVGRERFSGTPPFCPRCVMLEPQPEPARELVTA